VSFDPFGRSHDLAKLAAEGFELELTQAGHLLIRSVPFRTATGGVERGTIVIKVELNGDITVNPVDDHSARFIGLAPCNAAGVLRAVVNSSDQQIEPGLTVNHVLSRKLRDDRKYSDYYAKARAYVHLIERPAKALDPSVDARTFGPCVVRSENWPFEYVDTASGRAGIGAISAKLALSKIAIVGLGGTGAYILDLVAKCPVEEIHLFDGDKFSTHNAFRAPGAASLDQLRLGSPKVEYLKEIYSRMKRRIVAHSYNINADNVNELAGFSFVFLAMEGGDVKRQIVDALEAMGASFVDSSLGVVRPKADDRLVAQVQISGSFPEDRETFRRKVDFGKLEEDDPYEQNIQIAELNALNAALAVLWWKKLAGILYERSRRSHQRLNIAFNKLSTE